MLTTDKTPTTRRFGKDLLRAFARDEEGGIIVLTLLLLFTMLVVGGMSVDFMRYESERAELQSVSDRAVLAAAELDQTIDSKLVVTDFFEKAGMGDRIIGEPFVEDSGGNRTVRVDSAVDVNTFFLRLVGIDTLNAQATSSAIEGTGNVEVSLILDISGSMGSWVSSEGKIKMLLLQEAATAFIDDLLKEEYKDQISVNLIAYSQHVALRDDLYQALNTTPDTIMDDGNDTLVSSFGGTGDDYYAGDGSVFDYVSDGGSYDGDGTITSQDGTVMPVFTNPSRCVDFLPAEFNQLAFDTDRVYEQVERFQHYSSNRRTINRPVCPDQPFEGIIAMSQDAEELKDAIWDYRPTTFTSIHLGMKWGVSLLDPSMRDLLAGVDSVDDEFKGNRPADYEDGSTVKYIILMTDGQNVRGRRIEEEHYNTYDWQTTWADYPMDWWRYNIDTNGFSRNNLTDYPNNASTYDTWMQQMCDLAAVEMTVFTIAMGAGAGSHGEGEMLDCASNPSFAFKTNFSSADGEKGIDEIFETIAKQITALRLSL